MGDLWLALHWGSPIGLAIFFVGLGGMIYLLSKADEVSKRHLRCSVSIHAILRLPTLRQFRDAVSGKNGSCA